MCFSVWLDIPCWKWNEQNYVPSLLGFNFYPWLLLRLLWHLPRQHYLIYITWSSFMSVLKGKQIHQKLPLSSHVYFIFVEGSLQGRPYKAIVLSRYSQWNCSVCTFIILYFRPPIWIRHNILFHTRKINTGAMMHRSPMTGFPTEPVSNDHQTEMSLSL